MNFDNKDLNGKLKSATEQNIDYLNDKKIHKLEEIKKLGEDDLDKKKELNAELEEINKALDDEILNLGRINRQNKDLYNTNESILSNLIRQTQELTKQETKIDAWWRRGEAFLNATQRSFNTFKDINGLIMPSSLLEATRDAAKSLREMETSAQKLGMRAGQGVKGVKELNSAYVDLQKNLKDSAKNSKEIVETLSQTGYVENIKEAAEGVSLFDRATGASAGNTIDMMNALTKVGRMSSKESNNVLANIASIQKKNGLTKSGIDAVMKSTKGATDNMKLFGKSDMGPMIQSMTKLAASVEKVGISADKALTEIEKLTDPEKIEENIPKFAALGISINDALTGNMDNIGDQYLEGMKEFGAKLKEMGPIAGAQYAKAFGISYKDALKSLDAQESLEGDVEEDKSLKALVDMKEATLSLSASMQESINGLVSGLKGFSSTMLTNFSVLFAGLSSAITGSSYQIRQELDKIFNKESPIKQAAKNIADSQKVMIKYFAEGEEGLEDYVKQSQKRLDELNDAIERAQTEADVQTDKKLKKQAEKQIKYLQQIYNEAKKENDKLNQQASALLGKNSNVAKESAKYIIDAYATALETVNANYQTAFKGIKTDAGKLKTEYNNALNGVKDNFEDIKKVISSKDGLVKLNVDKTNADNALKELDEKLNNINKSVEVQVNTETARTNLATLRDDFDNLGKLGINGKTKEELGDLENKLGELENKFKKTNGEFSEGFGESFEVLKNKIEGLKDDFNSENFDLNINTEDANNRINEIKEQFVKLSNMEIKNDKLGDMIKELNDLTEGVDNGTKEVVNNAVNKINEIEDRINEALVNNQDNLVNLQSRTKELSSSLSNIRNNNIPDLINQLEGFGLKFDESKEGQEKLVQGLKQHLEGTQDLIPEQVQSLIEQLRKDEMITEQQLDNLKDLLKQHDKKLNNAATTVVNGEVNETIKRRNHNDENLRRQRLIETTHNTNETKRETGRTLREKLRDMRKSLENNKLIMTLKSLTMSFGGVGSILSAAVSFLASWLIQRHQENKMKAEMEKDTQNALSENTTALEKNTNKDETNRGPEKVFISDTGRVKYSGNITQDTKKETSTTNTPSSSVNTTSKKDVADKEKVSALSNMNSTLSGIYALMSNFNKNLEKLGDGLEKLAERTAANIQNVVNYNQTSNSGNNTGENIEATPVDTLKGVMQTTKLILWQ